MINCVFEDGGKAKFRHVTTNTLLQKDGKILLVKRSEIISESGKWAIPGGFLDYEETLIEGAKREVMEETGWEISDIKLFTISDNLDKTGDDYQNVDFIYLAKPIKKVGQPDNEVTEVKWFDLDELPPKDQIAFDHVNHLELYKSFIMNPQALPITR